ncbi:hypothetical protein J7E29_08510 [Streptomyces sp. ISL-90]|nr:hypothetical protein [Streptomyces sp. ISL-90]
MVSRRQRTALLAAGALVAGLIAPVALAAPAYAAVTCDVGGFEIDGNVIAEDCAPGFDDWDNVAYASTTQGGTYSASSKEDEDPATWTSAGNTPDKGTFAEVFSFARIADGDYFTYVAWTRDNNTGTGGYAIEITNAGERVADDGTPQPDRSLGGSVFYIEMQGADLPVFLEGCVYTSAADFPGDCSSDETGYFAEISDDGLFFEIGLNLTELSGVAPGCPPVSESTTVYVRSQTGQPSTEGNLKGYVAPLQVDPPSTCGEILVDKETLPDEYDKDFAFAFGGEEGTIDFTLNDATDDEGDLWSSGPIPAGTYTLEELVPAGWTLDAISCGTVEGHGTTIEIAENEVVTCVFTNTLKAVPTPPAKPTLAATGVDPASGLWLGLLLFGAGGLVFMVRRARATRA